MIPLSTPNINGNEWKYVKECLDTEWVSSSGKYVDKFEEKIAYYTKSKYAVACTNGTSALQVSLRLAGVQAGDEVIVPSLTFIAPVNAITYNNASPIFMDVDKFYNIDSEKTVDFINKETEYINGFSYNKKTKKRISAIIPVHMWGNAVLLEELDSICKERNISLIEDASESLGTYYSKNNYNGKHTGTVGDIGCLSFNGNKIITTGGGGMILTNNEATAEKAKYLTTQAKDDPIRYIHNDIGYNFRLTNIQAAVGVAQLEQLPLFLNKKIKIYNKYRNEIDKIDGLNIANVPSYAKNNHWMILLQIDEKKYGKNRENLMISLSEKNIQTRPAWAPIHLQKPYQNYQSFSIDKTNDLVNISLCLPSSTNISSNDLNKIISSLSL
tara:strand:+ start:5830 stop:6981 length:1152 start_codon:yes stop_codon:yes gene_type:complete